MSKPIDKKLYNYVKQLADKKFKNKTGIYKSSWIVKEYKRRGGKYTGSKNKNSGLLRWYREKWVDLNRPIKKNGKIIGYETCGRQSLKQKYPLCRPTYRISKLTPKTYKELSKKNINIAKKQKSKVKGEKNIQFGSGNLYKCKICNTSFDNKQTYKIHLKQHENFKCECCIGGTGSKKQYYGKKSEIMVDVPKNVKKWATYAFKLKNLGFEGAIETGWKRANQLSTKDSIPIEDLRYMRNWYARHIYTSYPTFKEWIKAGKPKTKEWHNRRGIQAWITWGANPGFKWINSDKVINILNKYFNKNYKKIKVKV